VIALALTILAPWIELGTPVRTTWDEPWHEEVVKEADAFVLARVVSVDERRQAAVCKVVRPLGGADVTPLFKVDGFCLLRLMSYSSGVDPKLSKAFHPGAELYLFVKLARDGLSYEIATPTSGFAVVDGDRVRACYRHSYHLALVERGFYERTQVAIFRYLHDSAVDAPLMTDMVQKYLLLPPKFVEDDPLSPASLLFFKQHAALETFYYLGSSSDLAILEPFLASPHAHVQISAVRALSRIDTLPAKRRQLRFLLESAEPIAKVQAIAGLRRQKARDLAPDLKAALPRLTAEATGFGGDLMDPRIGTQLGSSLAAAKALLADWAALPPK
jgi:hypothetical protein